MKRNLRILATGLTAVTLAMGNFTTGPSWAITVSAARAAEEAKEGEAPKETVRESMGKLLKEAQELMAAGKHAEALVKINEAAVISEKTPYESYVIARLRGATALGAGQLDVAIKAFDEAFATNRPSQKETQDITRSVAATAYKAGNYALSASWGDRYLKAGGNDPQLLYLVGHSYYSGGDNNQAIPPLKRLIQEDEKAGRKPAEATLLVLGNSQMKLKDNAGLAESLEKLVTYYPKPNYWNDLIRRVQLVPGFAERLTLDAYRLQEVTGGLTGSDEYVEMAALAIQAGFPTEGKRIADAGYAKGLLGSGPDAANHKKVSDFANKGEADDRKASTQEEKRAKAAGNGQGLVNFGFNLVLLGQADKGIAAIESGIAQGGVKSRDDAYLRLGVACVKAGKKEAAIKAFQQVQGADGAATLARLWILHLGQAQS